MFTIRRTKLGMKQKLHIPFNKYNVSIVDSTKETKTIDNRI